MRCALEPGQLSKANSHYKSQKLCASSILYAAWNAEGTVRVYQASPTIRLRRFAGLDRHSCCTLRVTDRVLYELSLQRRAVRLRNGAHNVAQLRRGAGCQLAEQLEAVVVHLESASAY
jgi:hypothetical protein